MSYLDTFRTWFAADTQQPPQDTAGSILGQGIGSIYNSPPSGPLQSTAPIGIKWVVGIAALWVAILATMALSYRVSHGATAALLPYLLWVTIASALNYYVWVLNP